MKKKTFITLLIGSVAGLLFAIGMCMCLLPEWNAFIPGVVLASIGFLALMILGVTMWIMAGARIAINWRLAGRILFGVVGALTLGAGMSLIMVWNNLILGITVGVVGLILLICLVPLCLGFKKEDEQED